MQPSQDTKKAAHPSAPQDTLSTRLLSSFALTNPDDARKQALYTLSRWQWIEANQ